MGMENGESYIKKILKNLCLSNGWSYGVFWRFDPINHMLLTMGDAYFEEHASSLMEGMLMQVHMLGDGIIGKAILNRKHRWMHNCLEDSLLRIQFLSGIKTVAVIPVELRGVIQFGSTQEIFETPEFLNQAMKFFLKDQYETFAGLNGENELFNSLTPSQNPFCNDLSTSWTNDITNSSTFDPLHFGEVVPDSSVARLVKDNVEVLGELDTCQTDDLSQWLADASKICVTGMDLEAILSDDIFSDIGRNNIFSGSQEKEPACSSQSSLTNALDSCREAKPVVIRANNNGLFAEVGLDFSCDAKTNPPPVGCTGMRFTECTSEAGNSGAAPKKGLFSELGLEHLLKSGSKSNCSSISKSCIEDQLPLLKRRTEACQMANDHNQRSFESWGVKVMQPTTHGQQMQDFGSLKECMTKAQSNSWVDAQSCIAGVNAQSRTEDPPKATKKRARPGESTRPRPKDRQLISDRIKDLRDLIPNGAKLSIDALLGRTIKHMIFLQNLNKHADKLKQVDEPKLIGQDNGLCPKVSSLSIPSGGSSRRNATWAYEVEGSNLLCPIIVEDLNEPGQMLIEMLCEERGYFLEIADIVRGFGLTILKGVMEARNDKIWAHFIVEGNKHITRMDVFGSLMQLLQGTNTSEVLNPMREPTNIVTNAAPIWGDFQQQMVPLPI
ncbi:transcription factor bHLH157 [Amaranthus tricolor]|uniref:transcription factor bHLH157 n=1 Tax=Amaranthus tricolor TaxID=29722 RepID=UPI0025831E23|nr:transcription factor bHLH157 [Amaranthus tricolor]